MEKSIKYWLITIWLLVVSGPAAAGWTAADKVLLSAIAGMQTIDIIQTHQMTVNEGYVEQNFFTKQITGEQAAWYEMLAIKVVVLAPLFYVVGKIKNDRLRELALWLVLVVSIEPVIHNVAAHHQSVFNIQFSIPMKGF